MCGSTTASKGWCFERKHPRRSPKTKHTTCTKCDSKNRSHGLCERHYKQAYRAGQIAPYPKPHTLTREDLIDLVLKELGKTHG